VASIYLKVLAAAVGIEQRTAGSESVFINPALLQRGRGLSIQVGWTVRNVLTAKKQLSPRQLRRGLMTGQ